MRVLIGVIEIRIRMSIAFIKNDELFKYIGRGLDEFIKAAVHTVDIGEVIEIKQTHIV